MAAAITLVAALIIILAGIVIASSLFNWLVPRTISSGGSDETYPGAEATVAETYVPSFGPPSSWDLPALSSSDIAWAHVFGGYEYDAFESVAFGAGGTISVTGVTLSSDGDFGQNPSGVGGGVVTGFLNPDGVATQFGVQPGDISQVLATSDGFITVAPQSITKYTASGLQLWQVSMWGIDSGCVRPDGSVTYLVRGMTGLFSLYNVLPDGTPAGSVEVDGTALASGTTHIAAMPNGDTVVIGRMLDGNSMRQDDYVEMVDPSGHVRWINSFSDASSSVVLNDVITTSQGLIVVVGSASQSGPSGEDEALAIGLSATGDVAWRWTGIGSGYSSYFNGVTEAPNGDIIAVGASSGWVSGNFPETVGAVARLSADGDVKITAIVDGDGAVEIDLRGRRQQ